VNIKQGQGGKYMRLQHETATPKTPFQERITAKLRVQASWLDKVTGESVIVEGTTENVGESTALVNFDTLPTVGSEISLRIINEETTLIEASAEVIRVERDPRKPLAALSVLKNLTKWNEVVMMAARTWVADQWKLNYEEEYAN
jgi:hypothetical protein